MESVIKTIDRDIKNITIIVFLGFVIITIYISFFSYAISPNNEQTFINHFSVDVNLKCNSDKFFFSEYSNIKCYIAAKSVDGYNYKNVQISIAAVDDRFNKSFWSCDAFFQNVTISNYAYYKLCKHPTDEYISTKSPTLIKFKLISLVAENSTPSFASIKFDGDIDSFFSPELRILPNEIEASAIATNTNSRLSYVALFGVIISVVFAGIIPFLVQRRQIEYDDKLHIKDQYKILSTLKNDLEKIELNIIGLEETIKSSIPLWLVHKPDISYFRQNLDTKINDIDTELLLNKLLDLSRHIDIMNFQINFLIRNIKYKNYIKRGENKKSTEEELNNMLIEIELDKLKFTQKEFQEKTKLAAKKHAIFTFLYIIDQLSSNNVLLKQKLDEVKIELNKLLQDEISK